ncbi:glycosyltransferase family 25 protein, partial [Melanomma pulvis-pyrius CBS 109.77]
HPLHRTTTTAPETLVEPANATLGFGALLAVSHAASPRRAGLVAAAHLARIEVTIPEQPAWTEGDVERFRVKGEGQGGSRVSRGSALAWLGHLNVLRWFLSTELETALILEDDVDFSLHLRSTQTPLAAAAIRTLLSPNPHPHPHPSPATTADQNPHYWGPPSAWELLYLGHCADLIPPSLLPATPHLAYHDPSAPPPAHLTPQTHALLSALRAPPATRLLHRSHWPLCTFAYAVTRASAARILSTFGTEDAGDGTGCVAFDVRLLEACRDRGWACYTVAPELFHHVAARSEI